MNVWDNPIYITCLYIESVQSFYIYGINMISLHNVFLYWGFPGGSDGKESACNV